MTSKAVGGSPRTESTEAITTVERFLTALAHGDVAAARPLITDDLEWRNVSLPTLRGARAIQVLRGLAKPWLRFDVILHHIAAEGDVVLTERTDLLAVGPLTIEFWVCGTFELRGGRIAVWRDYFSARDILRGTAIGVARLVTGRRGGRSTGYLSGA